MKNIAKLDHVVDTVELRIEGQINLESNLCYKKF